MAAWKVIRPKKKVADKAKMVNELTTAMERTVADGLQYANDYPASRSSYRRTGTLARSWSRKVESSTRKIEGIVGSNPNVAPYNKWVQGKQQTSRASSAGWRNQEGIAERMDKTLKDEVKSAIKRATR